VPRAGHVTAELNGRALGLYVLLEGWNRQFVQRHFPDPTGPLYEGAFLADLDHPPEVLYGPVKGSRPDFPSLLAAAQESVPSKRMARLESVLDLDRFTRLLALDLLAWNGDGYALHANNYRIFLDRSQGRFVFLPHGMDQMFQLPDAPLLASGDGLVARAVLSLPEGRRRVLDRIREFRNSFFQPESIRGRILELAAAMARGTNAPPEQGQAITNLMERMTERLASIDQQLAGLTGLVPLPIGQTLALTGWTNRPVAGTPMFLQSSGPASLGVRTLAAAAGAWVTKVWLEEGRYRLQGRVRLGATALDSTNQVIVSFKVRSPRKRSAGLDWGWDGRRRAEPGNLVYQALPAAPGTNWTELACEIDLRQPVADLEIICEASGTGEAWFELPSLKLTRLTDPGR